MSNNDSRPRGSRLRLSGVERFVDGVEAHQLLEEVVLHSFEPFEGQEGEASASSHIKRALEAANDFRRIYEMNLGHRRHLREPDLEG